MGIRMRLIGYKNHVHSFHYDIYLNLILHYKYCSVFFSKSESNIQRDKNHYLIYKKNHRSRVQSLVVSETLQGFCLMIVTDFFWHFATWDSLNRILFAQYVVYIHIIRKLWYCMCDQSTRLCYAAWGSKQPSEAYGRTLGRDHRWKLWNLDIWNKTPEISLMTSARPNFFDLQLNQTL